MRNSSIKEGEIRKSKRNNYRWNTCWHNYCDLFIDQEVSNECDEIIMKTYTLKVIDIVQETNDTKTICFKQPGLKKIKYQAGQYLSLIFWINGRRYIRPYSFSSAPSVDELLHVT